MAGKVEIIGLSDFLRDLKGMPDDIQKDFAKEMKGVAEIVATSAARKVPSKSGNAISLIVTAGSITGASVAEGGRFAPYMQWLDFGSRTPAFGNPRAVGPWHGSGAGPKGGRFLYPAIKENTKQIADAAGRAVDNASRKAQFK